jgi:DNA-binding response OmpR family regulator
MSNRDDVSVVVKCLRLGAAEYLVKPLRMNELLNLWTHVWRRRRMVNDTLLFTFTCVKTMLQACGYCCIV